VTEDDRKKTILEGAARLFLHYGPGKTTMADIAREAHIGVGTVYLVFPSKEAILEELSSGAHQRVLAAMRRVAEARAGDSFSERLAGVLETRTAAFQRLAAEGQHACELVHCKAGPVKVAQARFETEEHGLLVEILQQARACEEVATLDADRAARLVQRAFATLSPPWLFQLPEEDARRTAYEMCRLLLLGLMRRDAPEPAHPPRDPGGRTSSAGRAGGRTSSGDRKSRR